VKCPRNSAKIASNLAQFSFSLAFILPTLVCLDVHSVNCQFEEHAEHLHLILILYYVAFALVLLLVFVLLPLCYFFFDAGATKATDFDAAPVEVLSGLVKYACAQSMGIMLLAPLLIFLGYVCSQERAHEWGEEKGWVLEAEETSAPIVSGFQFTISTLGVVGLLFWVLSVADGLITIAISELLVPYLPWSWCQSADEAASASARPDKDIPRSAGRSSAARLTLYEDGRMGGLQNNGEGLGRDKNWIQTLTRHAKLCCPHRFRWILGFPWAVFVLTFTMLLGVSEAYNCVDRIRFASFDLGYILHDQPAASRWETGVFSALTPLDALLLLLSSRLFVGLELCLDFTVVFLLTILIVAASFNTYGRDGLRCLCGEVQKFKPAKTQPQTLVLAAAYTLINSIALCIVLLSVTPQWATFGRQTRHSAPSTADAFGSATTPAEKPFEANPIARRQDQPSSLLPCRLDDLRSHDGFLFKDECRPTQLAR
jgi:hypothetical protein